MVCRLTPPTGSSPRVRGKQAREGYPFLFDGLIPACAGKTRTAPSTASASEAHPRVCGENRPLLAPYVPLGGSSPRVRGKHVFDAFPELLPGLIPACAGKTPIGQCVRSGTSAHPRVCGENDKDPYSDETLSGSSPRVRGKQPAGRQPPPGLGLIPACAGKTHSDFLLLRAWWAHPRVCGENFLLCSDGFWHEGSSPRVRGKHRDFRRCSDAERLIPACAGKTELWERANIRSGAHPRVCGENARQTRDFAAQWGSSPRVRGKLHPPVGVA